MVNEREIHEPVTCSVSLGIDCGEFVGYGLLRVANWAADRAKVDRGRSAGEAGRVATGQKKVSRRFQSKPCCFQGRE